MFQALVSPSLIRIPGWLGQLGNLGQGTRISLSVLIWKMEIILPTLQCEHMQQLSFPQKTLVLPHLQDLSVLSTCPVCNSKQG